MRVAVRLNHGTNYRRGCTPNQKTGACQPALDKKWSLTPKISFGSELSSHRTFQEAMFRPQSFDGQKRQVLLMFSIDWLRARKENFGATEPHALFSSGPNTLTWKHKKVTADDKP